MPMYDFKFNLQLFAEGGDSSGSTGDSASNDNGESGASNNSGAKGTDNGDDKGAVTYDQETLEAKIADALKSERKKWEKESADKAKKAKEEAKRLESLSEAERAKEELEASRKELAAKEAELSRRELELSMTKVMAKEGVPHEFLNHLIGEDSESTLKNIKGFKKLFDKKVEEAVNERLKNKTPDAGGISLGGDGGNTGGKNAFLDAILKNQAKRR